MLDVEQRTEVSRKSWLRKFPPPERPRKITHQVACGQFVQVAKEGRGHAPFHHPLYAQLGSLLLTAIYFAGDQSEMCNEIANYI